MQLRARAVRRVLAGTLVANVVVALSKVAYGIFASAISIRADGFHSMVDSANNLVGFMGIWLASRPADADHPYGHHKFEIFAAGAIGLSLLIMAYDVAKSAALRLLGTGGELPHIGPMAFVVLLGTLIVNLAVARFEARRGEELKSTLLTSDAQHTRSDALVTSAVIVAVIFVRLGYPVVDLIAAFGVAGFIAWAGVGVLRQNLGYLADTALLDVGLVDRLARAVPGVASAHKIRTRGTPHRIFVDLHIQIAPHLNVVEAHAVTHAVIDAIKSGAAGVEDVLVHTEPAPADAPYTPFPAPGPPPASA